MFRTMEIQRTFDLLDNLQQYKPLDDILACKINGTWVKYSVDDYINHSYKVAYGLLALGYQAGTKVITVCSNRPEWNFVDMGINLAHMIHVPVYSTLGHEEFLNIFTRSDAEVIFAGNLALYKKIMPVVEEIDRKIKVILMDDSDETYCLRDLYKLGEDRSDEFGPVVENNKKTIGRDECASIIFTSGTTGEPKGVMLSHYNLVFNSHSHAMRQTKKAHDRMLSFLPLCHMYERTMNYEFQELGICIYYAESLSTIAANLKEIHADGFCAVPRVLELMYSKLDEAGKNMKGVKGWIYGRAWKFANTFDNTATNLCYRTRLKIFDKLIYSKWRDAFGGHDMIVVSGGSSISESVVRTFNAAQLRIFEGYGMTECSPVIAVNSPADGYNVIGTVGKATTGTELSFAEDGEILTRGPHIMLGYYKNPEATAEMIDKDGWLHTGDIGYLVDGQYLKLTDRKKEIFKLSSGKYIAPQMIENLLKDSSFLDNAFVFGENEKFASAIIVANKSAVKVYAKSNKIEAASDDALLENEVILKKLHEEVEEINKKLSPHEYIKKPQFVFDEWTPGNGMLSQTLKLKRRNLLQKYNDLVQRIYQGQ